LGRPVANHITTSKVKRASPTSNRPASTTYNRDEFISLVNSVHERVAILGVSGKKGE
jgi:hypothetical protein